VNRGNEFAQKFETLPGKLPAAKLDIPASVAADPDRAVETRRKCPLTAGFSNASFESLRSPEGHTADFGPQSLRQSWRDQRQARAIERVGAITSRPVLGGLHHQYCRI
jgi:hypothetical protein